MNDSWIDIIWAVASAATDPTEPKVERFRAAVNIAAARLSVDDMRTALSVISSPPEPYPETLNIDNAGLGGFIMCWQHALLELSERFDATLVPDLEMIAFGEYDWPQAGALRSLVRIAARGHVRARIVEQLRTNLDRVPGDSLHPAIEALEGEARADEQIASILEQLSDLRSFQEARYFAGLTDVVPPWLD